jgi:hypothetical protein
MVIGKISMVQKYKIQKKIEQLSCIKSLIVLKKYSEDISNNKKHSEIKIYTVRLSLQKFLTKIIGTIVNPISTKHISCARRTPANSRFSSATAPTSQQVKNRSKRKRTEAPQDIKNRKAKDTLSENAGIKLYITSAKKSAKENAENKSKSKKKGPLLHVCACR